MNIALERLIEGIIATLRADVIPNVQDAYARGQAVGVIDLLNNLGPRIGWAREPVLAAVEAKRALLREVGSLVPSLARAEPPLPEATAALLAERDRLDAEIGDVVAALMVIAVPDAGSEKALGLIRQNLHDELTAEMKTTRKPLFAEIASGADKKAAI